MTRRRDPRAAAVAAVVCVALSAPVSAQPAQPAAPVTVTSPSPQPGPAAADREARSRTLGDHFYQAGQFYRAVGAYQELALFSGDSVEVGYARLRIAMAYQRGHQYQDAVAGYDLWLAGTWARGPVAGWVRIQRALARAAAATEAGRPSLDDIVAELAPLATIDGDHAASAAYHLARLQVLDGKRGDARRTVDDGRRRCADHPVDDCAALDRVARAASLSAPRRRSPLLAVAMSAVVPGAGSFYTSHPVDGIYYLGLTAAGALGALDVYDGDRSAGDQKTTFYALATVATVTYAASLIQGYFGARRFNRVEDLRWRRRVIAATETPLPLDAVPSRLGPR